MKQTQNLLLAMAMLLCCMSVKAHDFSVNASYYAIASDGILAMEEASQSEGYNGDSEEFYEIDAIVNGTFDSPNQKSGWTDGVGEMSTGNHNSWTNVNGGFVEKWTNHGSFLGDMDFYQEISGLPSGTYRFAVYAIACQQSQDDSFEVSGVKIYANSDSVSVHTINVDRDETNRAIGPELIVVTTTLAEGETLKVGISVTNTDANWIAMDNAQLYATYDVMLKICKEDLKTLLTAAANINPTYSVGAKKQLDQAVEEGNKALNSTSQEQVLDAMKALEEAIARAERSVEINAIAFSANTVVSLTQFMENPNMDNGTIEGWTTTEGWQYQGNTHSGNGSEISRFQEHWIWSGSLGNTSTMQIVQDMPNGKYIISADVVATAQNATGDAKESTTGAYWIVNKDSVAVATYNNPEKVCVETEVTDGAICIEFAGINTTANWMAFDNVELIYCREGSDAELIKEGWTLSDDGHLVIYRNFNFNNSGSYPWNSQREQIISVEFSSSVTSIGNYAFSNCNGLKEVIFADGITPLTLGNNYNYGLFYSCPLETVYLGRNLNYTFTSYSYLPFYNKDNLTNVTISNSVTSIDSHAFYDCDNLSTLTIPNSVTSIGSYAFYGSGLTTITIPESVTGISEHTFNSCDKLTSITLPESLTNIGEYAFGGCSNLPSISIPSSVESIENYAFSNCNGLKEVIFADGITPLTLGNNYNYGLFYSCPLETVYLGRNLNYTSTSYGNLPFYNKDNLTNVTISNSVTSIDSHAFYDCDNLSTLTIPNSVTSIGSYAFYGSGLTTITIPESVTGISEHTFNSCDKLTSITLPESLTNIGEYAFGGCSNLPSISIPSSVESIENYAFSNCNGLKEVIFADGITPLTLGNNYNYGLFYSCPLETVYLGRNLNYTSTSSGNLPFYNKDNLTNVTISNSVTSIDSHAFHDCDNLSTLTIPGSVTSIGSYAFYGSGLTTITIPESVTGISEHTFNSCDKLTSITLPESLTNIGEYAFSYCSNLTSITIPKNVTTIGYYAFGDCTGELVVNCNIPSATSSSNGAFYGSDFSRVVIGEDVTTIGSNAFYYSDKLTTVFLSEDVTSIGEGAFYGCNNLYTVINRSPLALSVGSSDNGYVAYYAGQVLQGDNFETLEDFLFSDGTLVAYLGNDTTIELPKHYKNENYGIGSRVFYNNTKLVSVTIPEGVTGIGSYAFYGCNKLASVRIPEGVTSVGEYAFYKCTGLTSLIIPESIVEIGQYAFRYCTGEAMVNCNIPSASSSSKGAFYDGDFSTITIGSNVTAIGDNAFYNCSNLTSVTLPEGLKSIGNSSFYNCDGLASIDIPDAVVEIGYNAFEYCSSLTSVVIPEGVTSVNNATFANCSKLTTVNLSKNITEIGYHAFYNCSSLSSITIPESVTSIGSYAFYGCSNLLELTIPEGVTNVSEYTFANCEKLSSVTLPEGVTSIGSNAFYNCKSLSSIELPKGVTSIGDNAFYGCSSLAAMTIPEGVTIINNSTFSGCKNLAEISLPEGITSIGSSAFYDCNKLASIIIPESVTSIGSSAFYNCDSLISVVVPENVTSIGTYAFENCNSLVSVTIPDKVKTLSKYLFQNCSALTTVTVGTGVETINSYVLYNCNLNALLCYAVVPPSIQTYSFYQSTISAIYVPSASVELYKAADVWKDYTILAISDYTANLLTVSYEYGVGVTMVSLDASLDNSKIYYTLDGSDPLSAGILYEAPFEVNSACTLKAVAVCSGFENSNLINERIVIKNMPTINNLSIYYTKDITYDGAPHNVSVYASNGMGEITIVYKDANGMESTEAPSAVGTYEVSISVAEGTLFYAASFDNVASFTISVMDEVEWNALQDLYVQTDGASQWTRKWDMSGGIAAAASFYGITYRNGHIVELNLSNRNLVGQLPVSVLTLPYLERVNLSGNQLTGDLGGLVAGAESTSNVSYIDISNNHFSGNIGAMLTCFPKLEYLYAAQNNISEVSPALPENLYVNLSGQNVEDMLVWDGGVSAEESEKGLPTILTYNHRNQDYNSADWVIGKTWSDGVCWSIDMSIDTESGSMELSAQAVNYVYYGSSGDTLDVTASATMTASDSKAKIIYRFGQGDANFSGDVDVLDMQSTINFIFKEHQYYPFNHTAANVQNADAIVNVLDVIALINQLMAEELSAESLARARAKAVATMATDAYLYWEGNRLILETEKEIAALDIVLQETNTLQWNEALGMTMTSSVQDNYLRAIAYSLSGKYIPSGKHVLLTAQPCDIVSVLMADRAAQKVAVALKAPETTGIEKGNAAKLHCCQQDGWIQLIVDAKYDQLVWEVYTTDGCLIECGILEDVAEGMVNLLATDGEKAMIVVVKDNNGMVLTQKLK